MRYVVPAGLTKPTPDPGLSCGGLIREEGFAHVLLDKAAIRDTLPKEAVKNLRRFGSMFR